MNREELKDTIKKAYEQGYHDSFCLRLRRYRASFNRGRH